jgi:hypothetical protein
MASRTAGVPTARNAGCRLRRCRCVGREVDHVDGSSRWIPAAASSSHVASRIAAASSGRKAPGTRTQPWVVKCSRSSSTP